MEKVINTVGANHKLFQMSTTKDQQKITALCNKLFMYTDLRNWDGLVAEVFTERVWFDMASAGGEAKEMSAKEVCDGWQQGLAGLDALHHQAGHYLIATNGDEADVVAYAVAWHYKEAATAGKTRSFVGSYDLKAVRDGKSWRLSQFKYHLKFIDGNKDLH